MSLCSHIVAVVVSHLIEVVLCLIILYLCSCFAFICGHFASYFFLVVNNNFIQQL